MATMQCTLEWATAGGSAVGVNVLNFMSIGGSFNQATVDAVADRLASAKAATLDAEVTLLGSTVFRNDSFDPTAELVADNVDETGGSAGDLAPVNCCYLLYLGAGVGRRRRGRVFLPGVDESKVDNGGILVGTTASDILTEWTDAVSDIALGQGWLLGVGSRLDGQVYGAQTLSVSSFVHTQRRRMYTYAAS